MTYPPQYPRFNHPDYTGDTISLIVVIKSIRLRWTGHLVRMEESMRALNILKSSMNHL